MDCLHRLYLSKGKELVYIDNCEVPQHLDGIRFLYRLFKKKKSGAIVNDPIGFDKDVQIVLFLKAVCHMLDKTMLVLCPEGSEQVWLEMFRTWTDLGDDVAIELSKPYLKKAVIINGMANLPLFSQQYWSIVVVTDDSPVSTVIRYPFKADFRIWNTSVNMKKNLATFSTIFTWLNEDKVKSKNPVEKFNISDFTPKSNNVRDVIDKAVLLDAFMQDIVIRRTKTDCKLEAIKNFPTPKIVSKKNKDATGTKIKRSKRKIQDADTLIKDVEDFESVPKLPKASEESIDTVKPTVLELVSDNLQEQVEEFKSTIISQDSGDIKLIYEPDPMTENDMIYEMNTLVNDNVSIENINKDVHDHNQMECYDDCAPKDPKSNELNPMLNLNEAKLRLTNIFIQSENYQSQESDAVVGHQPVNEKSNDTNHELINEITGNQSDIDANKSNNIMEYDNENTAVNNDILTEDRAICNVSVNDNEIKETSDAKEISVKDDLDDFDLKNNEFKEQAMKRFKGSILDNIF